MELFNALTDQGLLHTCRLTRDGKRVELSTALCQQLGYSKEALLEMKSENIFTTTSLEKLNSILNQTTTAAPHYAIELTFRCHSGDLYHVLANGMMDGSATTPRNVYFILTPLDGIGRHLNELENANEVMSEMLQNTRVAYWCIEWDQAIDLNTAADDIVQQVFETPSHWRMCNEAMRHVYEMPNDVNFSQQPVRLYWPRSPANEEFVRQLIQHDFYLNGALSVDHRHDGSLAYVENDVRAHIEQKKMSRMWGSIYDVSQEFNLQQDAEQRIYALRQVFDAVPDAVVVVDENFHPQWRNAAFEKAFGIIQGGKITQTIKQNALMDRVWQPMDLPNLKSQIQSYQVHSSVIYLQKDLIWTVIVLRQTVDQVAEYELPL